MKFSRHFLFLFFLSLAVLRAEDVQYPQAFQDNFRKALAAYQTGNYPDAMQSIEAAEKIMPGTALLANFRGGIYFDQEKYVEATKWFKKALKEDPKFLPARLNLADIDLRKKNYEKARDAYNAMLAENPKNELLLYRVFLTWLLVKDDKNAQAALDKIPFPGDTPAHYFAEGAWAFQHGKLQEAAGYFNPGFSIFGLERCQPFAEPLIFLGWIKKPAPGAAAPSPAPSAP